MRTAEQIKSELERYGARIAKACKTPPLEVTVRGKGSFTFSFEGIDESAGRRIIDVFMTDAECSMYTDAECDMTFVYVDVR